MTATASLLAGDFTELAISYDQYRPGYSNEVIAAVLKIVNKPVSDIDFVDVGAGTGIWTRQVAQYLRRLIVAVEPNEAMRTEGESHKTTVGIEWKEGSAEETGLVTHSANLLSMASSFHWTNFDLATAEFHRVLKPGGWFVAVWNPRVVNHPLFKRFEAKISELTPSLKRVSSGKSDFVENLALRLDALENFSNLKYLEGRHTETFDRERYIGVWQSVSDIRSQMGEQKFSHFLEFVVDNFPKNQTYECEYLTRAWAIQAH